MAHVAVNTALWDSDEAVAFGELLGDPEAWRYLVRLWAWGLDAGKEDGKIALPPWKIASLVEFNGDPVLLFNALTAELGPDGLKWLIEDEDGKFYMRGWSCNRRFFAERRRLRARNERQRAEYDAKRDVKLAKSEETARVTNAADTREARGDNACDTQFPRGTRSPSRSPSLKEKEGADARTPFPLHPQAEDPRDQMVRDVIEAYCKLWPGRRGQAEERKVREAIRTRLVEGKTVEEMVSAIKSNATDQWCLGTGNTQLMQIVGTARQLDRWIDEMPVIQEATMEDPIRVAFDALCVRHGLGLLHGKAHEVLDLSVDLDLIDEILTALSADGSQPTVEDLIEEINKKKGEA